jgi:lipoate-protein ligase A
MNGKVIVISGFDDIYLNLASEEYCLRHLTHEYNLLYMWQSRDAVVIGKHQNPANECDLELLKEFSINLARRVSGGGAVYHDLGNLNYSFICARDEFDRDLNFKVVLVALQSLGIDAEVTAAYDLVYNNNKISGNAFYYTRHAVLHHGTLLVNSDLDLLYRVLTSKHAAGDGRGVPSRRSAVINLAQVKKTLTPGVLRRALQRAFIDARGGEAAVRRWDDLFYMESLFPYLSRQRSPEWVFGFSQEDKKELCDRVLRNA